MGSTAISDFASGSPVVATDRIPIARVPFGDTDNFYVTPSMLKTFLDAYYDLTGAAAAAQAASQPLDADLTALAALDATAGVLVKTGANTYARRTITGTAPISVADGAGTAANPTISLNDTAVTPGSYTNTDLTVDAQGRITAAANGSGGVGVTDGDKGDITVSSTGTVWTVDDNTITFAKMADMNTARLLGRTTASAGDPEEISVGSGLTLGSGYLSCSITQYTDEMAEDAIGGILVDSSTIDFTYDDAGNSITAIVKDASITLAKMADMATASVIYRKTAGTGVPEVQTLATLKTDLGLTGTNSGDQTLPTRASLGLDTSDSPQFAGLNVGHASDTTIARVSAGVLSVEGIQISVVAAETWTGNKLLAENVTVDLDAALSADGKYSGIAEDGTAGAALAFGEICYFDVATSRWKKAKADVASTSSVKLGACILAAAANGDPTKVLLVGKIRADALYPTMTIGAAVYLSAATAGQVTSAAPTGTTDFVVRRLGFANTGDELYFNPSNDYVTLV